MRVQLQPRRFLLLFGMRSQANTMKPTNRRVRAPFGHMTASWKGTGLGITSIIADIEDVRVWSRGGSKYGRVGRACDQLELWRQCRSVHGILAAGPLLNCSINDGSLMSLSSWGCIESHRRSHGRRRCIHLAEPHQCLGNDIEGPNLIFAERPIAENASSGVARPSLWAVGGPRDHGGHGAQGFDL